MKASQFLLILVIGALAALPAAYSAPAPSFFSNVSLDTALRQAAQQHKIVLVDFFTTWCVPCKKLDRTTWRDPGVSALLREKTIALKIDAEKQAAVARKYKIEAYPTLLLLRPDGSIIDRLVGYRDAATFIADFKSSLAGKTALVRAREHTRTAAKGDLAAQVKARYQLAQTLAREGHHAEALKEYLWLFDDGMVRVPSYVGVRGSFLLASIATLGRDYPPALAALRERRDQAGKRLSSDPRDRAAALDLAALNRVLREPQATLETYDKLPADSPARRTLGYFVFNQLLQARRYSEAVAAQPAQAFRSRWDMMEKYLGSQANTLYAAASRRALERGQLEGAAQEIEALAGAEKTAEARELIGRVLKVDDSPKTQALLQDHLKRAGRLDLLPTPEKSPVTSH